MTIGVAGTFSGNTPSGTYTIEVNFTDADGNPVTLEDPIIVLNATDFGGNKFAIRVQDILLDADGNATGFSIAIDEYENHDGQHPAVETFNYLAIERGVHTLPDGRTIYADEATADQNGEPVVFPSGTFDPADPPPVVMSTVTGPGVTNAAGDTIAYRPEDGPVVDVQPYDVTDGGFTVEINKGEGVSEAVSPQTVYYIAVEQGFAGDDDPAASAQLEGGLAEDSSGDPNTYVLDDIFVSPIVLAETQSDIVDDNNGNDNNTAPDGGQVLVEGVTTNATTGEQTVNLEFEEEQSGDSELNANDKTVGIVAFEEGVILCFTRDTLIETVTGPRPVQDLAIGDMIRTKDHGLQPLRWIGRKTCDLRNQNGAQTDHRPYRLPRSTFGPDLPDRDLFLSPQHRIAIDAPHAELLFDQSELLVPVKHLRSSGKVTGLPSVEYFHLMFDQHQVVYANGLPCESLYPGDLARDALSVECAEELFAIFPNLRSMPESYGPTSRKVLRAYETRVLSDALGI